MTVDQPQAELPDTKTSRADKLSRALQLSAAGVAHEHGDNIFRELVRHAALALDVEHAFIGVLKEGNVHRINVIAGYFGGKYDDHFEYDLDGTPCINVINQQFRFYPEKVQSLFPDKHLSQVNAQGYAAIPLFDSTNNAIGLMAILDTKPLQDEELTESILKIFSVRAAVELERRYAQKILRDHEAQLRQAQKMEAIGHLSGGIAHDFNNILTGVMGYIVMASERVAQGGDEKLQKYIDRAQSAVNRARDLIQQMLTFSRGQRGEPRPVLLSSLLKDSFNLFESTLPASVEIEIQYADDLPSVLLDPVHIQQVLMNLFINARDAMQGNGKLDVWVKKNNCDRCVCASCRQSFTGDYVEIAVKDSGPGINAKVMDRMFEPFFSTKETGKGSGMGLSTTHGIVHEYEGHIIVESEPGIGATFKILFPYLSSQYETTPGSPGLLENRKLAARNLNGSILLVDDDVTVRELMQDLLEDWGLQVSIFSNGIDALGKFSEDPELFDVVILDQVMPKMTGVQIAEQITKLRPKTPIILYTGYSEEFNDDELKKLGVYKMIKKPVDIEQLHAILKKLLKC